MKRKQNIAAFAVSDDKNAKVSIDDLTNRMAMLSDVDGRVSLLKRDLASLMHSYTESGKACNLSAEMN